MKSLNVTILSGHIGNIETNEEKEVLSFSLAVTYEKKENGEKTKSTDWVRCVGFGSKVKLANYLKKGQFIQVRGRLKTNVYQKDGEETKRKDMFVVIEDVIFVPTGSNS